MPPPTPVPLVELEAVYTQGEQLCAVPIPGHSRAIVAQGAALVVVDTQSFDATGEPKAVQTLEIPDISPMAMRYRLTTVEGSEQRNLYIAGGTTGVWRVALCNDLFTQANPAPCSITQEPIDRVGCDSNFVYKRCVDVEVIEGNSAVGGDGLLLALFSASSQHSERVSVLNCPVPGGGTLDLGGTELRAYRLTANGGVVPHATLVFSTLDVGAPNEEVGIAIAADPGNANQAFVSLGAGGIRRIDISTSVYVSTPVSLAPVGPCGLPNLGGGTGCPQGEQVRDLAVVRLSDTTPLLYAALEYGRVVELNLNQPGTATEVVLGEYFPMTIAARVLGSDDVIVAVGLDSRSGVELDSTCPYRPGGVWTDMCIEAGLPDQNNITNITVPLASRVKKVRLLARSPTSALANVGSVTTSERPNSLEILPTTNPLVLRLYSSTSVVGLQSIRLAKQSSSQPWLITDLWAPPSFKPFRGFALSAADVALAKLDDSIGLGGYDGWAHDDPGRVYRIVTTSGVQDIVPVQKTVSACASRGEAFRVVICGTEQDPRLEDPVSFGLGVAGTASWPDPFDPMHASEWFISGHDTKWFATPPPICAFTPDSSPCRPDPCTVPAVPAESPWADNRNIPGCASDVGWFLARMRTVPPATGSYDGAVMAPQFWQLPSDNITGDTDRASTAPYTSCVADPRTVNMGPSSTPVPKFIYLARNSAKTGLKIVRTSWLMDRALGGVPGSPAGGAACASGMRGFGEPLGTAATQQPVGWGANWDLEMLSLTTHLELGTLGCGTTPQIAAVDCSDPNSPNSLTSRRFAFNHSAHVFSVRDSQDVEHWVVAVAAGTVTSGPDPLNPSCPWLPYYRRALTVFYDVTSLVDSVSIEQQSQSVSLLAAAVGPDPDAEALVPMPLTARASQAFVVKTKTYQNGKTFAFVADLLGRVLVYDVSWSKLKPSQPVPPPQLPGDPTKPLLLPQMQHRFAPDSFDGRRPNCVDLEIEGNALYCATGRGGVHVLEIHSVVPGSTAFPTYVVLDTPGVATGLAQRPRGLGAGDDQLLVGDSRCGVRLYGRIGP